MKNLSFLGYFACNNNIFQYSVSMKLYLTMYGRQIETRKVYECIQSSHRCIQI